MITVICVLLLLVTVGNACSCPHLHTQEKVCEQVGERSIFIAQVAVTTEDLVRIHGGPEQVVLTHFELDPTDPESLARWLEMQRNLVDADSVRYGFTLERGFKGINETSGYNGFLYTSVEESLCGISLLPNKRYLIVGRIGNDDRFHVDICNLVIGLDQLSNREWNKIQKNILKGIAACNDGCRVTTCEEDSQEECSSEGPLECFWTSQMMDLYGHEDHRASHFCMSIDEDTCQWKKARKVKTT